MARLARNAGVICRQAKIAEAKKTGRDRCVGQRLLRWGGGARVANGATWLLQHHTASQRRRN